MIRASWHAIVVLAGNALNGPAGPGALVFEDGKATTTDTAVADAYIAAGFGAVDPVGHPEYTVHPRRSELRDAAVDPKPEDYKPPVSGVAPGISRVGEVA